MFLRQISNVADFILKKSQKGRRLFWLRNDLKWILFNVRSNVWI